MPQYEATTMMDGQVLVKPLSEAYEKDEFSFPSLTKWCYLVVGVEGSGNYMLRNALIAAGCYHEAKLDTLLNNQYDYGFENLPDKLAFHRSIPHAGELPRLPQLLACLGDGGYMVHVLPIMREPNATALSVSRRKGEGYYDSAYWETVYAYRKIADIVPWCEVITPITYEAFVTSEGFRRWLFEERLGLPYPEDFHVYNANLAYYPEDK